MAKHLWWRGGRSGWTFQIAIPQGFRNSYGATPFRVSLGLLQLSEAKRRARILAGYVTAEMGVLNMSRNTVTRGLTELAAQLEDVSRRERKANFAALRASASLWEIEEGFGHGLAEPSNHVHEQALVHARLERSLYRAMRERLDEIGREIVKDGQDWQAERQTYDRMVDRLAQQKPIIRDLPVLTLAAEEVINAKAEALTVRSEGYIARLRRAVKAFASIIGDKRVSEYTPLDVQKFATTLGLLPSNWATDPRLRDLSLLDIVKRTEKKRGVETLSSTTVGEYLSQFRAVWKVIRATYPHDVLSLAHEDLYVTLPRSASAPVARESLSVEKINRFLAEASRQSRPDDRYLPLLGALTGARLGELVYLQVNDIEPFGDHWIIRLIEDIEDEYGNINERKLKTDAARRLIALPDAIKETGFLEWVQGLRGRTLWPQLMKTARPHATASKHMMQIMKSAGVHVRLKQTFHSLRHSYKDHLRTWDIAVRTMDIQVGHALDTVGKTYGAKTLRPDEIKQLATLPLPEGLDLSPYRSRNGS
ncbi:tyrosine-type recombinase/integrase [Rhodopseudomonas palustris]|uniref:tyrosine-type recombinase/integrase n=1 Tax=Rhodopseudomonas palustris TaxID=1076 RepID=UPI000D1A0987|nr:tyrosine-type recombinase/integrase [Rhodopseudomonas palustris]AVT81433.1 hypothetical protein RPYSC3_25720 [Rhodopseudomonas palustris]